MYDFINCIIFFNYLFNFTVFQYFICTVLLKQISKFLKSCSVDALAFMFPDLTVRVLCCSFPDN